MSSRSEPWGVGHHNKQGLSGMDFDGILHRVLILPYLLKVVRCTPVQPTVLRTKLDHSRDCRTDGEELTGLILLVCLLISIKLIGGKNPTQNQTTKQNHRDIYWDKIYPILRTIDYVDEISKIWSQLLGFACSWIFPNNIAVICIGLGRNMFKLLLLNITTSKHFDTALRGP